MAALDWITIKGFKSIRSVERFPLRDINLLVGANGSGKSNFIGAFSFLNSIRSGRLQYDTRRSGGADRILHFGSKTTASMLFHISFEEQSNQYRIQLESDQMDSLMPSSETVVFRNRQSYSRPYDESLSGHYGEAGISVSGLTGIPRYVQEHLERWKIFQFHDTSFSSPLKKTCNLHDNLYLRADGSNLAAFLFLLRNNHRDSYSMIRNTVHLVVPFIDDFVLVPMALNQEKIRLQWKHIGSDLYFDGSTLSDGSLRFIALTTLLLQPKSLRPSVVLMDEPELGLHPFAIGILAALIRQASIDTQVILATQSSRLLDHFEPRDVVVANRVSHATELERLREEELKEWLRDYSLGQLWENNEIGGRPAPEDQ